MNLTQWCWDQVFRKRSVLKESFAILQLQQEVNTWTEATCNLLQNYTAEVICSQSLWNFEMLLISICAGPTVRTQSMMVSRIGLCVLRKLRNTCLPASKYGWPFMKLCRGRIMHNSRNVVSLIFFSIKSYLSLLSLEDLNNSSKIWIFLLRKNCIFLYTMFFFCTVLW